MLTLPFPPRRSELNAFWLALNGGLAFGLVLVALLLGRGDLAWIALVISVVLALFGLRRRELPFRCYRVWRRVARVVSSACRRWVLFVTYHVVLSVVARGGSSMEVRSPEALWTAFQPEGGADSRFPGRGGSWVLQIVRSARAPDRFWWLALLPFLLLISLFEGKSGEEEVLTNIYTLY